MTRVVLYVEGGGESRGLQAPLREGFHKLFHKLPGLAAQPKIIACGGRKQAFDDFLLGLKRHTDAYCMLLVDSEAAVADIGAKWAHVRTRDGDGWVRPAGVDEAQLQLMIQVMETWLIADPEALATYFGQGFQAAALPRARNLEDIAKLDVTRTLKKASEKSKLGGYRKAHGFDLIGLVAPTKIEHRCPGAASLFAELTRLLGAPTPPRATPVPRTRS